MVKFIAVGSGSKGNATIIYDEHTVFQVDMGVPFKRISSALSSIGRKPSDLKAVFFTHDHSDHIGTIDVLPKNIPLIASEGTLKTPTYSMPIGSNYELGDFEITSFSVSHDATNPVGYLIKNKESSLAYVTDTGYLSEEVLSLLGDKTYYIFESNHDYKMLLKSKRPVSLKQRIHGDQGHLSNSASACYLRGIIGPDTKGIYLAHISEECNDPELAIDCYKKCFRSSGVSLEGIELKTLKQYEDVEGGDK